MNLHELTFYILIGIPFIWFAKHFFKDDKGRIMSFSALYILGYLVLFGDKQNPHLYAAGFIFLYSIIIYIILKQPKPVNPFASDDKDKFKQVKHVDTKKILTYPRLSIRHVDKKDYIFDSSDIKEISKEFPEDQIMNHLVNGGPIIFKSQSYLIQEIEIDLIKEFIDYKIGTTKNYSGEEIPYNIQIILSVVDR